MKKYIKPEIKSVNLPESIMTANSLMGEYDGTQPLKSKETDFMEDDYNFVDDYRRYGW